MVPRNFGLSPWIPALVVCVLAGGTLAGRVQAAGLNWAAFIIHGVVFVGTVLFVTFVRMKLF